MRKEIESGTVGFSLIINDNRMSILDNVKSLFLSPRFISFYWRTGGMASIGLLNLIAENITTLGLPAWAVVIIGLAIGEGTKALSNLSQGKDLGFAKK